MNAHRLLDPTKVAALRCRLSCAHWIAGQSFNPVLLSLRHAELSHFHALKLQRTENGRIVVFLDTGALQSELQVFTTMWRRAWIFVHLFALADRTVVEAFADTEDSCLADGPVLSFSSNRPDTILIPDRGFILRNAYEKYRRLIEVESVNWEDRDDTIVWRGSPTGRGAMLSPADTSDSPDLLPRIRLCLRLRNVAGTDAKIVLGRNTVGQLGQSLENAGIAGEYIPESSWCRRRYAIDIDGNANAYSNFYVRLLFGCCVVKVESPYRFRQWYYDDLVPGKHYVPVRSDLSDLEDKIDWCRSHPNECKAIANAGQEFAMALTVDSELSRTVRKINAVLD